MQYGVRNLNNGKMDKCKNVNIVRWKDGQKEKWKYRKMGRYKKDTLRGGQVEILTERGMERN